MKTLIMIVSIFLVAGQAVADEQFDDLCVASGYFNGTEDRFMGGLASHLLLNKTGVNDFGKNCGNLYSRAFRIGQDSSRTGYVQDKSDLEIVLSAKNFSQKAYLAIGKIMGY